MRKVILLIAILAMFAMPSFADTKVSALTVDSTPYGTDYLYAVKNPGTTPLSRAVTMTNAVKAGLALATAVGIGTTTPGAGLQVGAGTISGTTGATSAHIQGNLEVDGNLYMGSNAAGVTNTATNTCGCKTYRSGICVVLGTCS